MEQVMESTKGDEIMSHPERVGVSNLEIVKKYNKDAFRLINEGLNLEDKGNEKEAKISYQKGLHCIEAALKLPNDVSKMNSDEEGEYKKIIDKLKKTMEQVTFRLGAINKSIEIEDGHAGATAPPLASVNDIPDTKTDTWQDVKELLSIKEGVQLLHVNGKGEISPWTSPCMLEIFQIVKEGFEKVSPPAFMKCGEWVYPMEPGQSPVLKSKNRTYMFPDITVEQGAISDMKQMPCIGVVLSELIPEAVVTRFERILSCYADFRKDSDKPKPSRPPPPTAKSNEKSKSGECAKTNGHIEEIIAKPAVVETREIAERNNDNQIAEKAPLADRISAGITAGSQWVSWGLVKGAEYTSTLVGKGATSLRERIKPNNEPTSVDPEISRNIRQLHQTTGSVVQISAFLVSALGTMTYNLGKKMAPHVVEQGQKLLPTKYKFENNENSQKKFEDVKKVAATSLAGFGMVFLSLEQAGKNLYHAVSNATVETLQHKYGDEVGDVSHDAVGAAGNALMAYWNLQRLGPKAIAKRAVKDTGKAILLEEHDVIAKNK